MFYENEVTMLVLGISVLALVLINHRLFKRLPAWPLLMSSFAFQVGAWIFTVLEGVVWETGANVFEHVGYMISALLLAGWCITACGRARESR